MFTADYHYVGASFPQQAKKKIVKRNYFVTSFIAYPRILTFQNFFSCHEPPLLLPQTANRRALNGASLAVGKVCAEKGIIGYVSVDFVAFRDADGIVPYVSHMCPICVPCYVSVDFAAFRDVICIYY
jgi:hypothetical protein